MKPELEAFEATLPDLYEANQTHVNYECSRIVWDRNRRVQVWPVT